LLSCAVATTADTDRQRKVINTFFIVVVFPCLRGGYFNQISWSSS
jgi:hypothetical protein